MLKYRILTAVVALAAAAPVIAQTAPIDQRVGKLEKEMRAVQRTVFPQGVPVQPDLAPSVTPPVAAGNPASAPIADLTARVDSLERQLATLTGASEQNGFKIKQLEDALARIQTRIDGGPAPVAAVTEPQVASPDPVVQAPPVATPRPATRAPVAAVEAPSKPDPARKAAVAAIELPSTGDAVEDDYTYGFRLYTAKFYPEAQAKLKEFTAKYPVTNKRWSYAQNLLGRAYFDEGKPALASLAFNENYEKAPKGERAADSLSQSLVKLKQNTKACTVFKVLEEDYGRSLTADQKSRAAKGRTDAKCAA
jgi:TolA-binding protein